MKLPKFLISVITVLQFIFYANSFLYPDETIEIENNSLFILKKVYLFLFLD